MRKVGGMKTQYGENLGSKFENPQKEEQHNCRGPPQGVQERAYQEGESPECLSLKNSRFYVQESQRAIESRDCTYKGRTRALSPRTEVAI